MCKVSICIPAYNNTLFLGKTLQSILDQDYHNYEVIVTDDSTNNDVINLIERFDFGEKLFYYKNESPLGSPKNWNYCLGKSTGNYIKFLHHDDWFNTRDALTKLVALIEDNKVDFAFCGCSNVTFDGQFLFNNFVSQEQALTIKNIPESLFLSNIIGAPSVTIFKKSNLRFNEHLKYLVDLEFYIRILKVKPNFSFTSEILLNIGHSEQQVTNKVLHDRNLMLYEYSYVYNSLNKSTTTFKWFFDAFWNLTSHLNIQSVEEIKNSKWQGEIPRFIYNILKVKVFIRKFHLGRFTTSLKNACYNYSKSF